MNDDEFRKTWIKVAGAIMEVAEKCEPFYPGPISKEIDQLKNDPLTHRDIAELKDFVNISDDLSHIEDQRSKLSRLISDVSKLKEYSTVSTEMENQAYFTEYCLKQHKEKKYNEPCEAMKYSLKYLKKNKTIFIIGDAVSGKTSFCLELMTKCLKKYPDLSPLILTESSQWSKIKFDKKYIIFIDDIVGKSNFNAGDFESWSRVFDLMLSRLDSVFIIFALRSSIWELKKDGFNDFKLFKGNDPVDLTRSKICLTSGEKLPMLKQFSSPEPRVDSRFSGGNISESSYRFRRRFRQRVRCRLSRQRVCQRCLGRFCRSRFSNFCQEAILDE